MPTKKIHVVLSGGSGSRLWPLSRKSRTKQYIPLFDNKSLFEITLDNNKDYCDEVVVVGNIDNYELSLKALADREVENYKIIVEAVSKNTAAAIAFAALEVDENDLLLVSPSDHIISNAKEYKNAIDQAFNLAEQNYLVAFGIQPSKAETGYGYIQNDGSDVIAFHEKPTKETAEMFLSSRDYLWNSGIFCFRAKTYLDELKKFRPDILESCKKVISRKTSEYLDSTISNEIPSESIDYAVMEKSERIKVVKGTFEWSDLGSFEALYDYFATKGMYVQGSNLVIAESAHVELHGLQDTLVVQSKDAILVMPIKQSQDVKKIYEKLKQTHSNLIE